MERRSIRRLAGLLGAVLLWGQATAQAAVTSLRVSTSPTKVRVVLDLDAPVTYKEDVDGTTLRLDLDTKTLKKFSQTPKDKAVRSLTVLPRGRDKCRLEVDLTKAGQHRVLLLKSPTGWSSTCTGSRSSAKRGSWARACNTHTGRMTWTARSCGSMP